ncbi:hypothetical protein DFQ28_001557, partial [Apophysomyces sp. BC1034]
MGFLQADINTIPTFHLVVKPSGSTPAKIVNNIPLPTPSLQSQQQPVLPAQTQAQPQLQPQLQPQQQIPSFSQPTAAASYSALLPGGYQVVAINGQYFLAPVLVPAYNPPSFQSHPTSTSQDTHYQPQQQQHNPAPAAAPGANRPRNEAQRAASVWLAMKLVVILFIICQGASIHRIVFFHIAAFFFFLYQTGRLRVVVRHVRMEELNNLGNESVRATVPPPTPPPTANTDIHTRNDTSNNTQRDSSQQSSTAPPAPPATAAVPGAPTTFLEALKRGAYTFLASLWPNYGHDPRIAQAFENGQQEGKDLQLIQDITKIICLRVFGLLLFFNINDMQSLT